ncbi:MAG: bifunctional riboflavin kinase/FAD synthetase [Chitinophagaceae bacterium]|nr:bifunctional riboflavin kinase/FAD synthetase [Chitinophagaceae bacterium]
MQVHTDIDRLPRFNKAVITIGTFDGVHLGHRRIISQLIEEASKTGGQTVIVTFHPHPRKIVNTPGKAVELLTTIEERKKLLDDLGVDHLVIVPFTPGFSSLLPEEYIEKFLVEKFRPHTVIIGYDHRFGKERKGDYKLLKKYEHLFELKEIPAHVIEDSTVSSTFIRQSLREGNIAMANSLLGYDYFFEGKVVQGDQRGRTIGFPTANLEIADEEKMLPGNGVYAVDVNITSKDNRIYSGMMNIGVRPTVDGTRKTIEVNIFDFNEEIYGQVLKISVKRFLRSEKKFSGIEELKAQLSLDRENAGFTQ